MHDQFRALTLALSLAVVACSGEAEAVRSIGESRAAILDGQPDLARSAVFAVRRSESPLDTNARAVCSGILVAPDIVMTARHCVARDPSDLVICGHSSLRDLAPAHTVSVANDAVLTGDSTWYEARAIVTPDEGDDACGFDLALIVLAEPIALELATPAELRLIEPVMLDEAITAVGYGDAGDGEAPAARLARSDLTVACVGSDCGYGVGHSEFMSSDGACRGDSGGPALDARDRVVGVLSRGSEPCAAPIWTSVSAFSGFLETALERTAEQDPPAQSSMSCSLRGATTRDSLVPLALIALFAWRRHFTLFTRRPRAATHTPRRSPSV